MTINHLLEDFAGLARGTPVALTDVTLEEHKLEAFEKGYQAGWDDAAKANSEDTRSISADFAQNLQDLSFTYQEAYSAALDGLQPLFEEIISALLPELMRQSLGVQIVEQLNELARTQPKQTVELLMAPENAPALDAVLEDATAMPLSIVEDASLAEGQIFIRFGSEEREIDLSDIVTQIGTAARGFFDENRKEIA